MSAPGPEIAPKSIPQVKVDTISIANRPQVRPDVERQVDKRAAQDAAKRYVEDLETPESQKKAHQRAVREFQLESAGRQDIQVDTAKNTLRDSLGGSTTDQFVAGDAIRVALTAEHNPDVIHTAIRIQEIGPNNWNVIFHESSKLLRGTRWESLTPEARAETTEFLRQIANRLERAIGNPDDNKFGQYDIYGLDPRVIQDNINPDNLNNPIAPANVGLRKVYDDDSQNSDDEQFFNAEMKQRLQKIQKKLELDRHYRQNPEAIQKDLDQLVEDMVSYGLPEDQVQRAVQRIERFVNQAFRLVREQRLLSLSAEGHVIIWSDRLMQAKGYAPHDDRVTGLRGKISQETVEDLIIGGRENREKWFSDWWHDVHKPGRDPERAGLEEEMVWNDFKRIIEWGLGDEGVHELESYEIKRRQLDRFDVSLKAPFASGDIKEFYNTLRRITPQDYKDLVTNFELSEYSNALIRQAAPDMIAEKMVKYKHELEYLRGKLGDELGPDELAVLRGVQTSSEGYENLLEELEHKLHKKAKDITRDQVLVELQNRHGRFSVAVSESGEMIYDDHQKFGELTPEADRLMRKIQKARDIVGRGAFLEDSDMLAPTALWNSLSKANTAYLEVKRGLERVDLEPARRSSLEARKTELDVTITDLWKQITKNENCTYTADDTDLIGKLYGFAPIDFIVRDRMIQYGVTKFNDTHDPQFQFKEWQIRDAIWAARGAFISWGESADLAASYYMGNALDLISQTSITPSGKDVMPAPHMEPIVRVKNPYAFADRFSIGRAVGNEMRNIKYQKFVEKYYPHHIEALKKDPEWRQRYNDLRKEQGEWRVVIQYLQDKYQIPYSELLKPNPLRTGLQHNSSTWRDEIAIIEAYRDKFNKMGLPNEAILDNQALSLRLNLLNGLEPSQAQQRKQLLYRKMERSPNEFIQLMAGYIEPIVEKVNAGKADGLKLHVGSVEWKQFLNSLTSAQMEGWNNKEFETGVMNLTDRNTFNRVVKPFMESSEIDAARINVYHEFLDELYRHARTEGLLDGWSKMTLPVVMPLSDFNWKETRYDLLNVFAAERRINDNIQMVQARDAEFLLEDIKLASPADWMETLKKLDEYVSAIVGYDGPQTAMSAAKLYLEAFSEFNRDRALNWQWLGPPGNLLRYAMINAREVNVEDVPIVKALMFVNSNIKEWVKHGKLGGIKVKDLPRSLSRNVSYSMYHSGEAGNNYDEQVFSEFFAAVERMGIFQDDPHMLHELRKKYGATVGGRFKAVTRKYLYYTIFATMAAAAMQSVDEEKKQH